MKLRHGGVRDLPSLGSSEPGGVLDHIRCEVIAKWVSGETPGGIFTYQKRTNKRFYSGRKRAKANVVEEEKGNSRPVSTKRLPQCVCSILSISKAGRPDR